MAWVAPRQYEDESTANTGREGQMMEVNGVVHRGKEEEKDDVVKAEEERQSGSTRAKEEAVQSPIKQSLLPDSPTPEPMKQEEERESDDFDEVERDQKRSGSSRLTSPEDGKRQTKKKNTVRWSSAGPTQTAEHLPLAREQAIRSFTEIKSNNYQHNRVGRSKGHEKDAMTCECRYTHGMDDPMTACGEDVGCINRLTQVECRETDCNCGKYCQNQRFQKHQYADVDIVQTEKKGFGLRARQDIASDAFIYEYIGEVVEQSEFMRRMQQYKDEGIRHYYFMMLQREEFIDATKRGGIARFINHSCNPNCYVAKWHVGKHMRMGIFSKRAIVENEELTFNYNVDRYGNEAQPCYCGEPNCVGSIGGKTQTDIGGMDQLFIDALGIADEVDRLDARGTRRKKSRHLNDEDFNPTLHPMLEDEVAKVMTAVRQAANNRTILQKLLSRIHMTRDTTVQQSLVRLHGFVLMASVLDEWKDDKEIVLMALSSLARWPLIARNKVVDSGVDTLVKDLSGSSDAEISSLACDLLSAWDALEMSYRIARREGNVSQSTLSFEHRRFDEGEDVASVVSLSDARAPNTVSARLESVAPKPLVRAMGTNPSSHRVESRNAPSRYRFRSDAPGTPNVTLSKASQPSQRQGASIEEIIRKANESEAAQRKRAEEAASTAAAEASKVQEGKRDSSIGIGSKRKSSARPSSSVDKKRRVSSSGKGNGESSVDQAERRLKKLVGEVVVRCMSSFKEDLNKDVFKKHAKELTTIVCEKEKRNPKVWPPRGDVSKFMQEGLSTEKKGKIKAFAIDYVRKLVAHKTVKHEKSASGTPIGSQQMEEDDEAHFDDHDTRSDTSSVHRSEGEGEEELARVEDESAMNDSPASSSRTGLTRLLDIKNAHQTDGSIASTGTSSTDPTAPRTPRDIISHSAHSMETTTTTTTTKPTTTAQE